MDGVRHPAHDLCALHSWGDGVPETGDHQHGLRDLREQ
eukprot:CAMPEP_0204332476 /NCGR_PEP_ID=MMETSP0469-20131031/16495_1 /ASSEMBLY_ACC=CAM_ASM_000384 /TAXON_ID=2969 /ORGANISM="Oxyrrhis marina" /LENGTH=37 /DNA_ID= /DNA_START= /DNA_END= /DNA_ORIENTATION=